jgi:hypothetical protein
MKIAQKPRGVICNTPLRFNYLSRVSQLSVPHPTGFSMLDRLPMESTAQGSAAQEQGRFGLHQQAGHMTASDPRCCVKRAAVPRNADESAGTVAGPARPLSPPSWPRLRPAFGSTSIWNARRRDRLPPCVQAWARKHRVEGQGRAPTALELRSPSMSGRWCGRCGSCRIA